MAYNELGLLDYLGALIMDYHEQDATTCGLSPVLVIDIEGIRWRKTMVTYVQLTRLYISTHPFNPSFINPNQKT